MADWMEQQISNPDEVTDEDKEQTQEATEEPGEDRTEFEKQLRTLLATNSVESLNPNVIEANIDDCSDIDSLQKAIEIEEREDALSLYEGRLSELEDASDEEPEAETEPEEEPEEEEEEEEVEEEEEAEKTDEEASEETETEPEPEPEEEESESEEEPESDAEEEESTSNPFASGGAETEEEPEGEAESDPEPEPEPEPESEPQAMADGNGTTTSAVNVKDIAPGALTATEAAERERRWTTMVWAEPGMGKSHFGMSSESPVCVIDTEGKADELAHKFTDEGKYDDPFIFQPSDFDGAKEALNQALSLLDAYREQEGVIGTIVVDSMSVMWGWSQQKYVEKFYPHADDASEVELSTGFGSGKSDWKQIKNYHNVQFRQRMIDSPYHTVWTAMSEDDYDAQINEGNRDAEKPAGEKENVYKVDEVIRLREGSDGAPIGELQKSGKVKHRYTGLRYPTFPKHQELIEAIDEAEAGDSSIARVESKFGVNIVEGNPAYAQDEDE